MREQLECRRLSQIIGAAANPALEKTVVFVLARAVTYGALFTGVLLVFVPGAMLSRSGPVQPAEMGASFVLHR